MHENDRRYYRCKVLRYNDGELIIQTTFKAILTVILINHANGAAEK